MHVMNPLEVAECAVCEDDTYSSIYIVNNSSSTLLYLGSAFKDCGQTEDTSLLPPSTDCMGYNDGVLFESVQVVPTRRINNQLSTVL
jgi:hypothetical protein